MGEKLRGDSAEAKPALGRAGRYRTVAGNLAEGYTALYEDERGFRDVTSTIELRPVYHHKQQRITAHIQLCWLALLLLGVAETETGDTWRNLRDPLERLHLVTPRTAEGTVAQRSELTARHKEILRRLHLPEPPRFHDFTPASTHA